MIKNFRAVLAPLLIISYVCGLRIVEFPTGLPRLWFSLLYILLFWSVYFFLLMYTVILIILNSTIYYSIAYHICLTLNIFTMLITIACGMYYDEKFRTCLKRIAIVDDTLEQLGITTDYKKLYTRTTWFVVGWFIIIILMIYMEAVWLRHQYGLDILITIYFPFLLNFCTHMNLIDDLIVANILGYLGLKFDQINENLRKVAIDNKSGIIQIWNNHVLLPRQCSLLKTSSSKYMTQIVIHLHLELRKISSEINSVFGIQLTLKMGLYFGFIALCFRETFNAILINNYMTDTVEFLSLSLFWIVLYVFKLFLINFMCGRVSAKANMTGNIMSTISYSIRDDEVRENISQFLLQTSQAPVKFYGLRLFQFGFEFFLRFITSVATVIVILIQSHTNN